MSVNHIQLSDAAVDGGESCVVLCEHLLDCCGKSYSSIL